MCLQLRLVRLRSLNLDHDNMEQRLSTLVSVQVEMQVDVTASSSHTPDVTDSRSISFAFVLMLTAFALFVVMDTSAKWLVVGALPALQVAFMRFAVHLIWVVVLYLPRQGHSLVQSRTRGWQLLRGLMLASATMFNFTALQYLPLPVTISIFFTGPIIVCLLSIPVLGERVGIRRFVAVGIGFLGVLVIVQPWSERFDWHILLSLAAAFSAAMYFVLSRKIRGSDDNGTSQFYVGLVGSLVTLPFAVQAWVWPTEALQWALLVLLGTLGMLGHTFVTRAHELAEASVLAPSVYSQMIFVTISSWFVFGTAPTPATLFGATIIIVSGLYIWWRERSLLAIERMGKAAR